VIVAEYNDSNTVKFYCKKCDYMGEYDLSGMIKDNCVFDVDVICELCSDLSVLYVLRCKDPAQAKILNATMEALRLKRQREEV